MLRVFMIKSVQNSSIVSLKIALNLYIFQFMPLATSLNTSATPVAKHKLKMSIKMQLTTML
jgi:hypothetical protein